MSKRDQILEPFAQFREQDFPHKIGKGMVRVYQAGLDVAAAEGFLVQHDFKRERETDGALDYRKTAGRFTVVVVYNKNDRTLLVAIERANADGRAF